MRRNELGWALIGAGVIAQALGCGGCVDVLEERDGGVADGGAEDAGVADAGSDAGSDAGLGDDAGSDAGCTVVRLVNVALSCRLTIDGVAIPLDQPSVCVQPGQLELSARPAPDAQLAGRLWHGTDGDTGTGESGTRGPLSLGAWSQTTPLPSGRSRIGALAANGYLYAVGGAAPSAVDEVLVAPLLADGSVGAWNRASALPWPLLDHGAIFQHGKLYVAGGWTGMTAPSEVLVATPQADGSLSPWTTAGTFGAGRIAPSFIGNRGHLHVLGGRATDTLADGRMATLDGTGMPGAWTTSPSFVTARQSFGAAAVGERLFIFGGTSGVARLDDAQVATTTSTGAITRWSPGPSIATARDSPASLSYGDSLFVLGGYSAVGYLDDVQVAAVDLDGGLSAWVPTSAFQFARMEPRATTYGGFIYLLGGYQNALRADVQFAPVLGNVSLARLTVASATRCVWVCCEGLDGTACPSSDQCP